MRASALYAPALALLLLGALTKSAQFLFHFLAAACRGPRRRLVSATCIRRRWSVKAGVFLLAVAVAGAGQHRRLVLDRRRGRAGDLAARRLCGDVPNDLKGLLAYSTISHLGLITLLLGLNSALAAVAAVFHMMNHATFKASLFMAVGIIDHETGTRDMRR